MMGFLHAVNTPAFANLIWLRFPSATRFLIASKAINPPLPPPYPKHTPVIDKLIMPGGALIKGTQDVSRVEAPVTVRAYLICAFAAFGGIFFGYDIGWMGGVLGMPYFIRLYTGLAYPADVHPFSTGPNSPYQKYLTDFHLTARDQSLTTSILSCGTFFGAIVAGDVADFIGRRLTIITGCAVFTVGCILETASTGLAVMVVGRLIAGAGVGFISAIVILYMSEIAPKKVRGALVAGYQFCITIGILLANCVVYATQDRDDTGSYRIPIAVQFLWALILAVGLAVLPDSPRYYVKMGKLGKAAKALASVRGQPIGSDYIQDELAEIIANYEYEKKIVPQTSYIGGWTNCFTGSILNGNSNVRRTTVGILMQMMQQLTGMYRFHLLFSSFESAMVRFCSLVDPSSGINFIFYFGVIFFQSLKTISNPFLITLITTLVNVCSTPISFYIIEKLGRRKLLLFGGAGMIIAQFIVGIIGVTAGRSEKHNNSAVSAMIAFICFNIMFFAATWGPTAWVVIGEIFPLPIRSRGVGLSTASNWFWNCVSCLVRQFCTIGTDESAQIIGVITPYLVGTEKGDANLGAKVFFLWGSLCCISFTFAYFLVPVIPPHYPVSTDRRLTHMW